MTAFTTLPYALPFLALGAYAAVWFARRLDRHQGMHTKALGMRRQAALWHDAVTGREREQGLHRFDIPITDINVSRGFQ